MATDNSPVVTEEKLLYFYNTYLKPYINAESGGHAIKNENDLLPLEQRETMVLNTPLMGSDDSTNEATVLDVDTNVDLSVIHAPGTRTPDEFEVVITNPQEGQVMRYNATSEQWENGDDYHVYSTDERVVGKWIDGSKIYEKTVYLNSRVDVKNDWSTVVYTDSNIDKLIDGKFYDTNGASTNKLIVDLPILCDSSGNIKCYWFANNVFKINGFTIRYTKTSN